MASIYGQAAKGIGSATNDFLSNPAVKNWMSGSSGGGVMQDPSIYGQTPAAPARRRCRISAFIGRWGHSRR
jgi:hypothetical protein